MADVSDLSQDDVDALGGDPAQITLIEVWDPNSPAGWQLVAQSSFSARVVCPKPCSLINKPAP